MVFFPQVSPQNPVYTFPHPIRATCSANLILLDFIIQKILGEQYRSSLCSFLHSPVTSSLLDPNTLLSTLLSNTFSLRSSLNVSDQVSHPYKTTDKIVLLCTLIFKMWIANWKTKDSAPNYSKHSLASICS